MFLTTHAAAGILISSHVNDPAAVFGLAFASHFVLDFVPHGDEHLYHDEDWKINKKYRRVILINLLDMAGVLGLIAWSVYHPLPISQNLILLGILGSLLPDFLSYLFPVIHERLSWLFVIRWFYRLTKPTGMRYLVRGQNWLHNVLHHELVSRDIPLSLGIVMQVVLIAIFLSQVR